MVAELLNKYIWLIQRLTSAEDRGLSLSEIQDAWELRFGTEYSRRSFNNHRQAIGEVFGIDIECNRSTNRYFIPNSGEVSDFESNKSWIIDTFTVGSIVDLGREKLSGRVSVEAIPSGKKHLVPIMDAMQRMNVLEIVYRKYGAESETYRVHPYAVKESELRWYLVGLSEKRAGIRVYALDRIIGLKILNDTFTMDPGFDVDDLFRNSFGSYLTEGKAENIIFRASGIEASYVRDLPLHKSQTVISEDGGSVTFSIRVVPNKAVLMEFLKHGPAIEILAPESIRMQMKELAGKTSELYNH